MSIVNPGRNLILHQGIFTHTTLCIAGNIFRQRHADSLHQTALNLQAGQIRIDRCTAVYRCRIINNAGFACLHINLKLNRTCHKRRRGNVGGSRLGYLQRNFMPVHGRRCDISQSDLLRLIPGFFGCEYLFSVKFHCIRRDAQKLCTQFTDLLTQAQRTPFGRFSGQIGRTRCIRT